MLLEPPHHLAIGTREIGAIKSVSRAFDSARRDGVESASTCFLLESLPPTIGDDFLIIALDSYSG